MNCPVCRANALANPAYAYTVYGKKIKFCSITCLKLREYKIWYTKHYSPKNQAANCVVNFESIVLEQKELS